MSPPASQVRFGGQIQPKERWGHSHPTGNVTLTLSVHCGRTPCCTDTMAKITAGSAPKARLCVWGVPGVPAPPGTPCVGCWALMTEPRSPLYTELDGVHFTQGTAGSSRGRGVLGSLQPSPVPKGLQSRSPRGRTRQYQHALPSKPGLPSPAVPAAACGGRPCCLSQREGGPPFPLGAGQTANRAWNLHG